MTAPRLPAVLVAAAVAVGAAAPPASSAAPAFRRASGTTFRPAEARISGSGRYVVFVADPVAGGTFDPLGSGAARQVHLADLRTGRVEVVSVGLRGTLAAADTTQPSVSDDGRYVVFASAAGNLVAGDTNGTSDVFVRDRATRRTARVSVDVRGRELDAFHVPLGSVGPAISADGSTIVYWTSGNVLASPTFDLDPFLLSVYAVPRAAGPAKARLVGQFGNGERMKVGLCCNAHTLPPPAVSADGRYVASRTGEYGQPGYRRDDVYVRDLVTRRTTVLRSYPPFTGQEAGFHGAPVPGRTAIDAAGTTVVFEQQLWSGHEGVTAGRRLVAWRPRVGTVEQVDGADASVGHDASEPALSGDGRWLVFTRSDVVARYDTGVGYVSAQAERDVYDADRTRRVVRRDLRTGTTTALVPCGPRPEQACGTSFAPSVSRDGRAVAFVSTEPLDASDPDAPGAWNAGLLLSPSNPAGVSADPDQAKAWADRLGCPDDVYVRTG